MKKIISIIIIACLSVGIWFIISEIYTAEAQKSDLAQFEVKSGESISSLADRLESEQIIRSAWIFKKYLVWKGIDEEVRVGQFEIMSPITLARVVNALGDPSLIEKEITIIPGWTIRDVAQYLEREGIAQAEELTEFIGLPAVNYRIAGIGEPTDKYLNLKVLVDKPNYISYEGYLAPDTYRIYKDATVEDIVDILIDERNDQITDEMYQAIVESGRNIHEVITLASILEREVRGVEDKKKVADIFWRRYDVNWALQADSTVHYAVGKTGNLFTTNEDRDSLNSWNTYKYPGLPPGPISNPSLETVDAAIYPEKNDYWYFLTDSDGTVHYAKTLEEHNANVYMYLR
ncbi:endolytic transglycosylase MltG [Patescibacteria group bacterium]|nr:endolytic transglycosylase MltG [Patescibacteria group bacterium]MBU1895667.1 endolytic transglycosylase MltG [Patescibacteria group bacterium]